MSRRYFTRASTDSINIDDDEPIYKRIRANSTNDSATGDNDGDDDGDYEEDNPSYKRNRIDSENIESTDNEDDEDNEDDDDDGGVFLDDRDFSTLMVDYLLSPDDVSEKLLEYLVGNMIGIDKFRFLDVLRHMREETPQLDKILQLRVPSKELTNIMLKYSDMQNRGQNKDFDGFIEVRDTINAFMTKYNSITDNDYITYDEQYKKLLPVIDKPKKHQILDLETSDSNKEALMKWNNIVETLPNHDDGKTKDKLLWGLSLPYNKMLPFVVDNVSEYLVYVMSVLDKRLYGMKSAKMEILHILNDTLSNNKITGKSMAFVGPPGVGKCLAPETLVLMFDGSVKSAKLVVPGDRLMGDNSSPREVVSVCEGHDEMYSVYYCACSTFTAGNDDIICGVCEFPIRSYTVNSEHILVLLNENNDIIELPIKNWIKCSCMEHYKGYRVLTRFNNTQNTKVSIEYINNTIHLLDCLDTIPADILLSTPMCRRLFLYELIQCSGKKQDNNIILLPVENETVANQLVYLALSLSLFADYRSVGRLFNVMIRGFEPESHVIDVKSKYGINIRCRGLGKYHGFVISDNRRFLLADFSVTHNTELARSLSEVLQWPFEQISMGGAESVSFLKGMGPGYIGAEPGQIVKVLRRMGYKNGIIYLDELDKIPRTLEGDGVTHTLLEITDPVQNTTFRDSYLNDIVIDLSHIWFIYSLNDETKMDNILNDRIHKIYLPGYELKDKIIITREYLLPGALRERNFDFADVKIPQDVVRFMILNYTDTNEKGIRSLKRLINVLVKKINMLKSMKDSIDKNILSYNIKDFKLPIELTIDHVRTLLEDQKKTEYLHMYM
jgi:hypothetical protein